MRQRGVHDYDYDYDCVGEWQWRREFVTIGAWEFFGSRRCM
jgi:hypothetical protein